MNTFINPPRDKWEALCARPSEADGPVRARVAEILSMVRDGGDEALRRLSMEIDSLELDNVEVGPDEMAAAAGMVPEALKSAIRAAAANIAKFHQAQKPGQIVVETSAGVRCIQKPVPIGRVGLYVPGGTASLFSTVLMLAIPAKLAGCAETSLCTPPGKDGRVSPTVLYAASLCGVGRVFKVGGAQAIAAMAYGTESVPKADKIFGPGNRWVTTAKQLVGEGVVSIDMPAGPSEVMVVADDCANPAFVAADLLSQAEHGADSQVTLICRSAAFAEKVEAEMSRQEARLGRQEYLRKSLERSNVIVFEEAGDAIDFANAYAPEHLIINTSDPWKIADAITAAGSVFVGAFTPESAGDYASGTNHSLPTNGWARSCSGVNMDAFMRKMTIQEISREGLSGLSGTITAMAKAEGLPAHANAVEIRLQGR